MPVKKKSDLPDTIQRSPAKAQRTYAKALNSAIEEYGDGRRAHQTAYAALKHSFAKEGDHWVPKERKGPSDPGAKLPRGQGKTFGGVDFEGSTKKELYERAKKAGVEGRSRMNKEELASAVARRSA